MSSSKPPRKARFWIRWAQIRQPDPEATPKRLAPWPKLSLIVWDAPTTKRKRGQSDIICYDSAYYIMIKRLEVFQKVPIGNVSYRVSVTQKSKSFRADLFCWLVVLSVLKFEIQN